MAARPITRAANRDAHPGRPDMGGPRRSSQQVQEERAALAATEEAKRRLAAAHVTKAAALENAMELEDGARAQRFKIPTPKVMQKAERGKAPVRHGAEISDEVADLDSGSEFDPGMEKEGRSKQDLGDESDAREEAPKQRKIKNSCLTISNARKQVPEPKPDGKRKAADIGSSVSSAALKKQKPAKNIGGLKSAYQTPAKPICPAEARQNTSTDSPSFTYGGFEDEDDDDDAEAAANKSSTTKPNSGNSQSLVARNAPLAKIVANAPANRLRDSTVINIATATLQARVRATLADFPWHLGEPLEHGQPPSVHPRNLE
ncbi:hypothetical protein HYDPIDRAFT_171459 [Hydnomerulius pinastri MD-312]|uniref:Uncharacterized protein n=1 Tax=Hydnomerulius pinastri MD-312 TaxID=994086 RepID=A0A0C9UY34_9AGAM|nr:hypothetical protein HYDPIDRAFT_171459 [Hydnomerulius pinastri MD-312]